ACCSRRVRDVPDPGGGALAVPPRREGELEVPSGADRSVVLDSVRVHTREVHRRIVESSAGSSGCGLDRGGGWVGAGGRAGALFLDDVAADPSGGQSHSRGAG